MRPGIGTQSLAGRAILDNSNVTGTFSAAQPAAAPQLVIFDLDGTLTDSADGIVSSFRHALGQIGAAVPPPAPGAGIVPSFPPPPGRTGAAGPDGALPSRIVGPPMHHTLSAMG